MKLAVIVIVITTTNIPAVIIIMIIKNRHCYYSYFNWKHFQSLVFNVMNLCMYWREYAK